MKEHFYNCSKEYIDSVDPHLYEEQEGYRKNVIQQDTFKIP